MMKGEARFLQGVWSLIKFSSLSAPTKIEELTVGSDEKTKRSPAGNRGRARGRGGGSIPGGAAMYFFV